MTSEKGGLADEGTPLRTGARRGKAPKRSCAPYAKADRSNVVRSGRVAACRVLLQDWQRSFKGLSRPGGLFRRRLLWERVWSPSNSAFRAGHLYYVPWTNMHIYDPPWDSSASRAHWQRRCTKAAVQSRAKRLRAATSQPPVRIKIAPSGELPEPAPGLPLSFALSYRYVTVVTTASLPWLTGTSVNPLLRAACLEQQHRVRVTLMVPWLSMDDQRRVYPKDLCFETPADQEAYIRQWLLRRLNVEVLQISPDPYDCLIVMLPFARLCFPHIDNSNPKLQARFRIVFYPARYDSLMVSIFAEAGFDMTDLIPESEADVAILEEPEHLCWYHFGRRWRDKFRLVVGIAHTNYVEYVRRQPMAKGGGAHLALALWGYSIYVARANCHKVIRLSEGVQHFAKSVVSNVHGVAPQFLAHSGSHLNLQLAGGGPEGNSPHPRGENPPESRVHILRTASGLADLEIVLRGESDFSGEDVGGINEGGGSDLAATEGLSVPLTFTKGCYFIGKMLWSKGYRELCDLLLQHVQRQQGLLPEVSKHRKWFRRRRKKRGTGFLVKGGLVDGYSLGVNGHSEGLEVPSEEVVVDAFGSGAEEKEIEEFAREHELPLVFHGRRDHADESIVCYKVFVNPSCSDVLCTTTAEALAMGKFVVVADHPSNTFFAANFPENTLLYDPGAPEEFSHALQRALAGTPAPLTPAQRHLLTWEAGTERFMQAAALL